MPNSGQFKPASYPESFWSKVNRNGPIPEYAPHLGKCWIWTACKINDGYGQFKIKATTGLSKLAHRHAYELVKGKIPPGLTIDHLCRVRHCVNPDHLEAVTQFENAMRGMGVGAISARKTHCLRGHEFTPENTYPDKRGKRVCRTCTLDRQKAERIRRKTVL